MHWICGEGSGTPLQYSCLENPMDREAWKAAVHGVAEGWTWLSDFSFTFHFHALEKEMATHSSVLAWRIPGKGEPGGLPSMGSHRVRHDWSDLAVAVAVFHFSGSRIKSEQYFPGVPIRDSLSKKSQEAVSGTEDREKAMDSGTEKEVKKKESSSSRWQSIRTYLLLWEHQNCN